MGRPLRQRQREPSVVNPPGTGVITPHYNNGPAIGSVFIVLARRSRCAGAFGRIDQQCRLAAIILALIRRLPGPLKATQSTQGAPIIFTWLLSLLASFILIAAMSTLVWWRRIGLSKRRGEPVTRLCGCSGTAAELERLNRNSPLQGKEMTKNRKWLRLLTHAEHRSRCVISLLHGHSIWSLNGQPHAQSAGRLVESRHSWRPHNTEGMLGAVARYLMPFQWRRY